jgi:hypothetical protein
MMILVATLRSVTGLLRTEVGERAGATHRTSDVAARLVCSRQQAVLICERDGLRTGVDIEFPEDALDVSSDSFRADEEPDCDLVAAQPLGDEAEYLELSRR